RTGARSRRSGSRSAAPSAATRGYGSASWRGAARSRSTATVRRWVSGRTRRSAPAGCRWGSWRPGRDLRCRRGRPTRPAPPARPAFDEGAPAVRDGLAAALAGYRSDRIPTIWPWQRVDMVVAEPVGRDSGVIAAVVTVSATDRLRATIVRRWGELGALGVLPL